MAQGEDRISLYFHVPFCLKRCNYCSFYSSTDLSDIYDYTKSLENCVSLCRVTGRKTDTVYFGGGTPSLLKTDLGRILDIADRKYPFDSDAEITLEANPSSMTPALLKAWHEMGFNRISIGLQSTDDVVLKTLGRLHDSKEGIKAVTDAFAAGFENISADIMLGLPGQNALAAEKQAEVMSFLPVEHLSAYLLKVEEGTPFFKEGIADICPSPDESADIYLAFCERIRKAGFEHYEISNFAKPGFESRHNTAYWTLKEYIGFGPSAHSYFDGRRCYFASDLGSFIAARDQWDNVLDEGEGGTAEEYLMLSLRLKTGMSIKQWEARGQNVKRLIERSALLVSGGLMERDGDRLSLTEKGFLVSNSIISTLM